METIRTIETPTLRMDIWQDIGGPSPREDDNLGTIWTWERAACSPDKPAVDSLLTFTDETLHDPAMQGALVIYLYRACDGQLYPRQSISADGVMFVSADKLRHEYGDNLTTDDLATARRVLDGELAEYNAWATGDVYGFTLYLKETCRYCDAGSGEHAKGTCNVCKGTGTVASVTIDQVGGFYGYDPATNGMCENLRTCYAAEIRAAL